MDTVSRGRHVLALALTGAVIAPLHATEWPGGIIVERGEAFEWEPGDVLRIQGDQAIGVRVAQRATFDAEGMSMVHEGAGSAKGRAYGILVLDGAGLSLTGSHIDMLGHSVIGVQAQRDTTVDLRNTVIRLSPSALTHDTALAMAGGTASLVGTSIDAARGHAISSHFSGLGTSSVTLEDSTIRGRIGSGETGLRIDLNGSSVDGDIVRDGSSPLDVRMLRSAWHGKAGHLTALSLEDSGWTVTADSEVAAMHLDRGGRIAFERTSPGFKTLRVGEWQADAGARGIELGTRLDAGGALSRQATDRLLVSGDAVGTTPIHVVNIGGRGASTAGRSGVNGSGDGISLVQVGGTASAASFRLAGDYVAVGPWQYRLQGYEPGRSDPDQRLLGGKGGDFWDFRLQSARVDGWQRGAGGNELAGLATRPALVPQVPSYLVLAHALFGYGASATDALQLVELDPARESALRVHTFGGSVAYRSSLSFSDYGIDYKRHDRGVQVTGDLLLLTSGDTTVRAGMAASLGGTRVSPDSADGRSDARIDARGLAWHALLTMESGWRVASSYAVSHYRVDVRTPARGEALGRLRANGNEVALSTAYRWQPVTRLQVEPGATVLWQRLRFGHATDRDGVDVRAGKPERGTLRAGTRASLSVMPQGQVLYAWSPYVDLRYAVTRGSGESIVLSGERIATGRAMRSIEISTGARFHLWSRVTTYVDIASRKRVGRHGESGLSGRAGLAVTL